MSDTSLKLSVGYPCRKGLSFYNAVAPYLDQIGEVYFGWEGFASGRAADASQGDPAIMLEDLRRFADGEIRLNLLLNGNCYGGEAISCTLEERVKRTVSELGEYFGLQSVTAASPFIAETVKKHFPEVDVRASVNMWVDGVSGMEQCADIFDSFYLKRDYNYCPEQLESQHAWCRTHGKRLYLLANSGCIPYCAYHTFHDNLVSHSAHLDGRSVQEEDFQPYACRRMMKKAENRYLLLSGNLVRPEDIDRYADFVDGVKLATRIHPFPAIVIGAYARRRFRGDVCSLTEPGFGDLIAPYMLDNAMIPKDYWSQKTHCMRATHNGSTAFCKDCGYCAKLFNEIKKLGI